MHKSKLVGTYLGYYTKLSITQAPSFKEHGREIAYSNRIGNIMYEMMYSILHLTYVVSVVSKLMVDSERPH